MTLHSHDAELSVQRSRSTKDGELGEPLTIQAAARIIGCSAWSVRHTLLRQGLPHFRSGPNGKLIFYSAQVVRWIQARQKVGSFHKRRRISR